MATDITEVPSFTEPAPLPIEPTLEQLLAADSLPRGLAAGSAGLLDEPFVGDEMAEDEDEALVASWPKSVAPRRWVNGVDWPVAIWIGLVHLGAIAAFFPYFFTWKGVAVGAFLAWLTGSVGVCMGYHRQLTHRSFETSRPVRWLLAFLGGLSGEGSAITWVANHRKHHAHSDQDGDPHTPRDGGLWSHMIWFMPALNADDRSSLIRRYAPDLAKDRVMRWLDVAFLPTHLAAGGLLMAIGWAGWDLRTGMSFVVWGMFVRLMYVLHVTWFVNSASHMWGYRNYKTTDDSRNLWWVGLLAFGEGWHNNHHAFPRMAPQGHRWWEVDTTYWVICLMEKVGLAWNVVRDLPPSAERLRVDREN